MSKWTSPDGTEIESCCILTTEPNNLIKSLHNRMPVVVPNGYEEEWTEQVKDSDELKGLLPIMMGWSSDGWLAEKVIRETSNQMRLCIGLTNLFASVVKMQQLSSSAPSGEDHLLQIPPSQKVS